MSAWNDFNDAEQQQSFDLIPKGTIARVRMTIKPGGYDAHCLNLPMYLLTHPKERARLGIPHYRVGKLVRFKLHELETWMLAQGGASNA